MCRFVPVWMRCQKGATAIEYALLAAGISLAIMLSVLILGDGVAVVFEGFLERFAEEQSNR